MDAPKLPYMKARIRCNPKKTVEPSRRIQHPLSRGYNWNTPNTTTSPPFCFFFNLPFRFSTNILLLYPGPKLGHTLSPPKRTTGSGAKRKHTHISGQTHSTRRFAVITRTFITNHQWSLPEFGGFQ
ncbi:hypothetical protein SORBI_3007G050650 [Sorghum bicolor]|uniref:Uncharacterized protein n=1 Tax=Sorghum bicolor TaxID=4558 RepID=A0A1Z5R889_SORBI|nr:hypothetical protein SORBI_3007G050650 [Sorghum bicolor]